MRRLLLLCLLSPLCLAAVATEPVTFLPADSITICRLLREAPDKAGTLWFARRFKGIPYVAHTLEVNETEQLVVNTRQLDCTTLVETVTALTLCVQHNRRTWCDYVDQLCQLRYRQGRLDGYASRLHYFSDWIVDKTAMQFVNEIQAPNPPFTAVQHIQVGFMSQHPSYYKALKADTALVALIRQQEQALSGTSCRYIPKAALRGNNKLLRQTIHDGDIIAITCSKPGLEIAHLGFAVWRKDGLHLLNASQLHKRVVEEPMTMYQYLQKHPTHTGIRIIRVKN